MVTSPCHYSSACPCRQEAVPVLVGDKPAESQLFYLLGEIDQGSGLGLGRWSIFLANVGEGHSRAESHAALASKSR